MSDFAAGVNFWVAVSGLMRWQETGHLSVLGGCSIALGAMLWSAWLGGWRK